MAQILGEVKLNSMLKEDRPYARNNPTLVRIDEIRLPHSERGEK